MNDFKDSAVSDSSGLSKDEKKREWANTRICQLAAKFIKTLTPENINDLCEVADSQICIPDKNGVFTYSFKSALNFLFIFLTLFLFGRYTVLVMVPSGFI